jgi:hypothetical protein
VLAACYTVLTAYLSNPWQSVARSERPNNL